MDNLRDMANMHKSAIILAGGDFNIPDIQWNDMSIADNQNPSAVNEKYLHTFQDLGLEQLVDFPNRYNPDNTLDRALTNRSSLVQRCVAIPGLSDHAAVLITTKLRPAKSKPPKRKILLWKRADMIALRHKIDDLAREFTTTPQPPHPGTMGHIRLSHPEHHEGPNPFQVRLIVLYQAVGQRYHQTPFP